VETLGARARTFQLEAGSEATLLDARCSFPGYETGWPAILRPNLEPPIASCDDVDPCATLDVGDQFGAGPGFAKDLRWLDNFVGASKAGGLAHWRLVLSICFFLDSFYR